MHGRKGHLGSNDTQRIEYCDYVYIRSWKRQRRHPERRRRKFKKRPKKKRKRVEIEESEVSDNYEHHSDGEDQIGSQESEMLDCIIVQTK